MQWYMVYVYNGNSRNSCEKKKRCLHGWVPVSLASYLPAIILLWLGRLENSIPWTCFLLCYSGESLKRKKAGKFTKSSFENVCGQWLIFRSNWSRRSQLKQIVLSCDYGNVSMSNILWDIVGYHRETWANFAMLFSASPLRAGSHIIICVQFCKTTFQPGMPPWSTRLILFGRVQVVDIICSISQHASYHCNYATDALARNFSESTDSGWQVREHSRASWLQNG